MKHGSLLLFASAVVATIAAFHDRPAFADTSDAGSGVGGAAIDGGADAAADTDASESSDSGADAGLVALACDGSLCDTTNGSTCTASSRSGDRSTGPVDLGAGLAILAAAILRRGRRQEECQP